MPIYGRRGRGESIALEIPSKLMGANDTPLHYTILHYTIHSVYAGTWAGAPVERETTHATIFEQGVKSTLLNCAIR